MAKYSINNLSETELSSTTLRQYYSESKKVVSSETGKYPNFDFTDLNYIFEVACENRALFTAINAEKNPTPKTYVYQWILTYCSAIKNPPSKRVATAKSSCDDPIIKTMVKLSQGIGDDEAFAQISNHKLCMSAENVLGNLLEEFIAEKIRPYEWIWCTGETLRAIDFCNVSGTVLLQIKNKSNSENSSSSNIREGTTIKKWFRLGTSKQKGTICPSYKWDKLNAIINKGLPKGIVPLALTEDDFEKYITDVVKANNQIITKE